MRFDAKKVLQITLKPGVDVGELAMCVVQSHHCVEKC
jgi:hypothetical protein